MTKLSENIEQTAILKELEKQAFLRTVGKVLKHVDLVAGQKGVREGLKVLEKHKGPMFALPKGALKNPIQVKTYGDNVGNASKFVLTQLGDTAHAFRRAGEGISKDKSLVKNISTVGKNLGKLLADQTRGSAYKTLSPSAVSRGPGGRHIKGKGLFKHKVFNRKIKGETSAGDYIVRKRKGVLPLSMALTPGGFGAGTFLLGSGRKKETLGSRTAAGIQETALWSLAPPAAQVKLISDMLK